MAMLTLHLTTHTNPTQQCTVTQIPFNIGSDPDNDLVISDKSVDSFHAQIIKSVVVSFCENRKRKEGL
jgi:predicted component of type VI protein secretion system